MAEKEEPKKVKKEKYVVGELATQTERVIMDGETGKVVYADLMESQAAMHNKLDRLLLGLE